MADHKRFQQGQSGVTGMAGMDAKTGRRLEGGRHLAQSIGMIASVRPGANSVPLLRSFGSESMDLIDRPVNGSFVVDTYFAVASAIRKWEDRLRLERVQLKQPQPGRVALYIEGVDTASGEKISLETEVTR
jgi:phage baseplate assembly protein W